MPLEKRRSTFYTFSAVQHVILKVHYAVLGKKCKSEENEESINKLSLFS